MKNETVSPSISRENLAVSFLLPITHYQQRKGPVQFDLRFDDTRLTDTEIETRIRATQP